MWILFSLSAAFLAAVVITLSKAGIKNVDSSLAFAIQSVLILIVAWSVVIFQGHLPDVGRIERKAWIFLILAGVITCLSSLCSFHALKLGAASRTSALDKVSLVFSITLAVVFLKDKVNWQLIVGALLMAAGAVFVVYSDKSVTKDDKAPVSNHPK
ncbi:EamA family transporter [Hymenobacter cavernae]|uniref:Membrane protein n=1 Tax=Hymenobacter cavernae TaxID=2044852 RepID=A0ABQ1UTI1_9BACT|nr:EamA family transporter [Hymenobacter cavernae]GGF24699.1 membrane protein [Hymenobacter cavernae]